MTSSTSAKIEQSQAIGNPAKAKILVVDDSRLVRVSVRKLLQDEFEVVEAVDGEDGWNILQEQRDIQVALTDVGMPKLDGFGLIDRVRHCESARLRELPLVLITGAEHGQSEIRERALNCGASDFFIKPFDKVQLVARIRSYVKQDKLTRDLAITTQTLNDHSTIDPFTKLQNRHYFMQRCEQELALAARHKVDLCVIGMGLDEASLILRKYGTQTLQQVILWVAELLKPLIRKEDCLIRSGESEFLLITPATDRMSAAYLCERLRKKIKELPYNKTVIALPVSISLGLVSFQRDATATATVMLEKVQRRVGFCQHQGGNRFCANEPPANFVFTPTPLSAAPVLDIDTTLAALSAQSHSGDHEDLFNLASALIPLLEHINSTLNLQVTEQLLTIKNMLIRKVSTHP